MREVISTIVNVANQDPEVTKAIGAVMLHLRSREMLIQKRAHILISVLMSLVIRQVLGVLSLFFYPLTDTLKFFGFLIFITGGYQLLSTYGMVTPLSATFILALSFTIVDVSTSTGWFRHTVFDLFDIITCGTLTKLFSYFLIHGGQSACESAIKIGDNWYSPPPIANHFFSSRQAYAQDAELTNLMDQMIDLSREASSNAEALLVVRRYWDSQP